ncbi:conserved hypothetical protein [Xanthomonas citri pv. fuscans]|nr:conserved hypothetical protein [Xanthomonas citri pv. fuscans]SON98680.1 conserved hypothetical protein [Xanthomonas citri pv. fuscans]SOO01475.1 conserved hypothetical protein [Xanthomonas citri pv. fuscans]SOO10041.1 conserved hypothetical protein [Xanthomonas citri pv. fuscans]SOO14016.1 conserved hypothetical protein [Xanthomonas citri pv. fuscans]
MMQDVRRWLNVQRAADQGEIVRSFGQRAVHVEDPMAVVGQRGREAGACHAVHPCKDIKVIDSVRQAAVRPTCGAQSATSPKVVNQAFALIAKQVRVALARHVPARTRQRARPFIRTNARQIC